MAGTLGKVRWLSLPVAFVVAGAALGSAPVDAATTTLPCDMRVTLTKKSSETSTNGVERAVYTARVTYGSRSQTATVQRMVMPPGAKPKVITKKLGELGQLRAQLESNRGRRGIAAVNGDFFYDYRIEGRTVYLPRSASVANGRAVRLYRDRMRVIGVDKKGNNYIGEVGVAGTVAHGPRVFTVDGLNWHRIAAAGVVVFTRAWSSSSDAPRPRGSVEWVVKADKIRSVRIGSMTGKPVPKGAKIVAFGSNWAPTARRAKVGSAAIVGIRQETSAAAPLQEAMGRGLQLVKGGSLSLPCTGANSLPRPRTTVGWTASGRWMTLTVPGSGYDRYGYRYGGLGLSQESKVALALGFTEAAELDGGGSTTAYVRRADRDWDRVDEADGIWQRPVPNSLVFVPGK